MLAGEIVINDFRRGTELGLDCIYVAEDRHQWRTHSNAPRCLCGWCIFY
jgi:hypothetical protein